MNRVNIRYLVSDVIVIGGGASGLFLANSIAKKKKDINIIVFDKGNMKRSGCLSAGINAINLYLDDGDDLNKFIDNVMDEFIGIVREDIVKTIGERLGEVTREIEKDGLVILKNEKGEYVRRGERSLKINGENIKEILYRKSEEFKNIKLYNNVNIYDLLVKDDKCIGVIGFSLKNNEIIVGVSRAIYMATGGASGIYKNNFDKSKKNKMWYSPFNVGSGYAMGIRNSVEMTSFEIRFVALRIAETIAPTGTIAQGISGKMINKNGEEYIKKYNQAKTVNRLFGAIEESKLLNGPCFIKTKGIGNDILLDLKKAYLNMAPYQVLFWEKNKIDITNENVEITGTEPYIVGGHSVSGFYVDTFRRTTLKGLYAGGDVSGGCGKKYVTGAFAEGLIAAETILEDIKNTSINYDGILILEKVNEIVKHLYGETNEKDIDLIEEELKETMDKYCGGISSYYEYKEEGLKIGFEIVEDILNRINNLKVKDFYSLLRFSEVRDRALVALALIKHMDARKERRIRIYNENSSYKYKDEKLLKYVNSVFENGNFRIILRDIIKRGDVVDYKNK